MKPKFMYAPAVGQAGSSAYVLEIACFSLSAAITASKAGADRIELCDNPAEGGTTPSYGVLKQAREKIDLPVFPIIRPRGGDFLYNDDEYQTMLYDVEMCKDLGFDGVVLGLLTNLGGVDIQRTSALVKAASPMQVTFHRAFDRCINPFNALESIIFCGCSRLLTSGQVPNAFDGKELIKELVDQAEGRLIIMPGSGVRSSNICGLATDTGATELHSSARKMLPSPMIFKRESMQENNDSVGVDEAEIRQMKWALGKLPATT